MSSTKQWHVQTDYQDVYDSQGQARTITLYVVEGPAPFGGTFYTDKQRAQDVTAELNRLHAPLPSGPMQSLHVGMRRPNEPDFTPY